MANKKKELEPCVMEVRNCSACEKGMCLALADIDYEANCCPFYKPEAEQVIAADAALEHLVQEGRTDLIKKYYIKGA